MGVSGFRVFGRTVMIFSYRSLKISSAVTAMRKLVWPSPKPQTQSLKP